MTVTCGSIEQFMDVVYASIINGLQFQANAEALEVNYTGGY